MKNFKQSALKAVFLAISFLFIELIPTAYAGVRPCTAQKQAYSIAVSNYKTGQKQLNRAAKDLSKDSRYYENQINKAQRYYERVDYRLNFLQSQQIGGFVGTFLGGGWGLNGNVTLNSRIEALKGEKHYTDRRIKKLRADQATTIARRTQTVETLTAKQIVLGNQVKQAEDAYLACIKIIQTTPRK
jgi:Zn-dependent metalloprotease